MLYENENNRELEYCHICKPAKGEAYLFENLDASLARNTRLYGKPATTRDLKFVLANLARPR